MTTIEMRCPVGPKRLFAKLQKNGEEPIFTDDNLIEFACSDCRKDLRRWIPDIALVLHRYDFRGELIETEIQDYEGEVVHPPLGR